MPRFADRHLRRRLGAWYTPDRLVEVVLDEATHGWSRPARGPLRVLDPACGDGRFLAAIAERLGDRCELTGVDVDPDALQAAKERLGSHARLVHADALRHDWPEAPYDLVIGNPPFLSQLSSLTSRGGASSHGGGAYADAAVEFLALAHRLVHPDLGRVALVLPLSVLASRDAGPVRRTVAADAAVRSCWWAEESVFPDAAVHTCALVIERGVPQGDVRRLIGLPPSLVSANVTPSAKNADPNSSWAWLVADQLGSALLDERTLRSDGVLGDRAVVRADFRQHFYGLIGAVGDDLDGPPLVTSGLIDPGVCHWGTRLAQFAGRRYLTPRVDLSRLDQPMRVWASSRLVPKVLVASQTREVEAVADPRGEWLPSVPVVSVIPHDPVEVWACAAVLSSSVATAWLMMRSAGTGRSARSLRVSAPVLAGLPWPQGDLTAAVEALRHAQLSACASQVERAYGVPVAGSAVPGRDG